jgi:hypothetical protein
MNRRLIQGLLGFLMMLALIPAYATQTFTITQTSPAAGTAVDMGTTQAVTFQVANNNTAPDNGQRIYLMRFRTTSPTYFSSATTAPAGWKLNTAIGATTTSITFQALTWNDAIAVGTPVNFTVAIKLRTNTGDYTETMRDARATYTNNTTPLSQVGSRITKASPANLAVKSLAITSFQTTDLAGVPTSTINAGVGFKLVMTVKNLSTTNTASVIQTNPIQPSQAKAGTWNAVPPATPNWTGTVYNPNPLTLAPGASGTITFTYGTNIADSGTVKFTANARTTSGTTMTSRSLDSNILSVSPLNASIAVTPTCIFSGGTATFTMTVTNNGAAVINLVPSGPTRFGTAAIGAFSAPTYAPTPPLLPPTTCPGSLAGGGAKCDIIWTAAVTGTVDVVNPKPNFWVTGSVSANAGLIASPVVTSNTVDVDDYIVSVAPVSTSASSTNEELTWTVTNRGCANVDSVAITVPGGWTFGGDAYSLVTDTTLTDIETWTVAGTTFTAPLNNAPLADPGRMPLDQDGQFMLVFPATPTVTGNSNFTVRVTDENGTFVDKTTTVTVNAPAPGGANAARPSAWREEFR